MDKIRTPVSNLTIHHGHPMLKAPVPIRTPYIRDVMILSALVLVLYPIFIKKKSLQVFPVFQNLQSSRMFSSEVIFPHT